MHSIILNTWYHATSMGEVERTTIVLLYMAIMISYVGSLGLWIHWYDIPRQKRAASILTGANRFSQTKPLFEKLNWISLTERIQYHTAVLTYKAKHFMTPQYRTSKFSTIAGQHGHATWLAQSSDLKFPQLNLELYRKSFNYMGAVVWNSIQPSTRNADSVKAFKAGYCRSMLG